MGCRHARERRFRRLVLVLAAFVLVAASSVTASSAKTPPKKKKAATPTVKINPIFTYNKADREQHLYQCAKSEGSLTLYTSTSVTDSVLKPAFQSKYPGVTLNTYVATTALVPKLEQEEDSGRHNFDVYSDAMGNIPITSKYFQPFWSPYMKNTMAGLSSNYYLASAGFIFAGLYYNPNLVSAADVPKTYQDLLKPQYTGKIYLGTDSSSIVVTALLRRTYGNAYYQKLAKQVRIVNTSGRGIADMIIAGTAPMGLSMSSAYYKINHLTQGAPFLLQVMNPMYGNYSASSISKHAPHPCAAMLFVDWLNSPSGAQPLLANLGTASPYKGRDIVPFAIDGQLPQNQWKVEFQTTKDLIKGFKSWDQAYAAWSDLFHRYYLGG